MVLFSSKRCSKAFAGVIQLNEDRLTLSCRLPSSSHAFLSLWSISFLSLLFSHGLWGLICEYRNTHCNKALLWDECQINYSCTLYFVLTLINIFFDGKGLLFSFWLFLIDLTINLLHWWKSPNSCTCFLYIYECDVYWFKRNSSNLV